MRHEQIATHTTASTRPILPYGQSDLRFFLHTRVQVPPYAQVAFRLLHPGTEDSNRGRGRCVDPRTAQPRRGIHWRHGEVQYCRQYGMATSAMHATATTYHSISQHRKSDSRVFLHSRTYIVLKYRSIKNMHLLFRFSAIRENKYNRFAFTTMRQGLPRPT